MGHFLSRAIKRFTQCNSNTRNQLHELNNQSNREQQATTNTGPRESPIDQDPGRPTVQSIPVGQSIDSAEYAAFKTASSSIDRNKDNSAATSQNEQSRTANNGVNNSSPNDEDEHEITGSQKENAENEADDQNKPQVEEAVIKIQALVRGHLTRKALKDAQQQQQAAAIPPNALGQSQFDEESLRNPPNVLFSNVSPPQPPPPQATNTSNLSNTSNNQQQQSNKPANNRVPPLESIAEDVESTNATRVKRKLSSPKSASDTSGESAESQSTTSPSNEANASIDLHCDTPASASIDIMDHSTRLMPGIATVLHHREPPASGQEEVGQLDEPISSVQPGEVLANSNNNNNFKLQNGSSADRLVGSLVDDQRQTITTSSLPSSPPHINLALATNLHSIDSAEAAAIRIQSAFRGYHTRKHSPYRRRSPASAPVGQINNGPSANGQPRRNTLRQQNATILDDDDGHEDQSDVDEYQPDGSASRCRLDQDALEQANEETRQSRERHRVDETQNVAQVSHDEMTSTDDQSTVKELPSNQSLTKQALASDMDQGQTVLSAISNGAAAAATLTGAEQGEHWSNNRLRGLVPAEARWSTSIDTDSSNLGAALSLTDDLSEGISQTSQGRGDIGLSGHHESLGAAIEDITDGCEPVERGAFGQVSESYVTKQLDELERATDQLEAALEEATDNEACSYGDQLAANLADNCLDDTSEQNLNELESDDIERRHPNGVMSESLKDFDEQTQQQAALVASNSLDDQEQDQEVDVRAEQLNLDLNQARLEAISPDEEIGSGGSSPALVASKDGNSSADDGADSDQDQDGQQQQIGATSFASGGPTRPGESQQAGNNKNKKRTRNKKKGKK